MKNTKKLKSLVHKFYAILGEYHEYDISMSEQIFLPTKLNKMAYQSRLTAIYLPQ